MVATIRVLGESEVDGGWWYEVRVSSPGHGEVVCRVRLSWADYDLWSGGAREPALVIERLFELLLEVIPPEQLRPRFDAGLARRIRRDLDDKLPRRL